ncbi:relaxase/mobilization nuclease [Streptomyces sp. NBC_00690]|uniref:relaxase/mobilization nuclease n=1 Tax=Streptomyces sp. NBC_00690 TaxID=2975808 RepID=UPI002E2C9A71|nr:relaxase/mobilization nuclease [Streptomyces sp. NBC_00690]
MIPHLWQRGIDAAGPLEEALGRPVTTREGLTDHIVVAHWNLLGHFIEGEEETWTSAGWAEHLDDPTLEFPFAADEQGIREPLFHLTVELHPQDREPASAEWSEIAHRLARATGIAPPGDQLACRWIAVQAQPGRLDLVANLIRLDGTWQPQSAQLPQRLAAEARRIEADLGLRSPRASDESAPDPGTPAPVAGVEAEIGLLLRHLADGTSGPLATVRGVVEHSAHRLAQLPGAYGSEAGQRLEWSARRLDALQRDLDATATALCRTGRTTPQSPGVAAGPPAAPAYRSR